MEDEQIPDMSKTYIYEEDGCEYMLTGRTADRAHTKRTASKTRRQAAASEPYEGEDLMVEIKSCPRKTENRSPRIISPELEFKWVKMSELFAITDMLED